MEKTNREIRALLSSMAPARAAQAVRLVGLPPDEETAVLAVDVHGQSCLQAAALLHVSVDGLAGGVPTPRSRMICRDEESRVRFGHGFPLSFQLIFERFDKELTRRNSAAGGGIGDLLHHFFRDVSR